MWSIISFAESIVKACHERMCKSAPNQLLQKQQHLGKHMWRYSRTGLMDQDRSWAQDSNGSSLAHLWIEFGVVSFCDLHDALQHETWKIYFFCEGTKKHILAIGISTSTLLEQLGSSSFGHKGTCHLLCLVWQESCAAVFLPTMPKVSSQRRDSSQISESFKNRKFAEGPQRRTRFGKSSDKVSCVNKADLSPAHMQLVHLMWLTTQR